MRRCPGHSSQDPGMMMILDWMRSMVFPHLDTDQMECAAHTQAGDRQRRAPCLRVYVVSEL